MTLAEGLKAQADLRLGLHGAPEALKLAGEVRVLKARYQREFTEKPPPLAAARGDAPRGGREGRRPRPVAAGARHQGARDRQRLDRQPHGEGRDRRRADDRRQARRAGRARGDQRDPGRGVLPLPAVPARERHPALRAPVEGPAARPAGLDLGRGDADPVSDGRAAQQAVLPPDLPAGDDAAGPRLAADDRGDAQRAWRAGASGPRPWGPRSSPASRWSTRSARRPAARWGWRCSRSSRSSGWTTRSPPG